MSQKPLVASFQFDDRLMGRVGSFCGDEFTPPAIPFPHHSWVTRKGLRCCEIFCAVVAPQAVRPAKGRHAAIRRNPGSREDSHVPSGCEVHAGKEDLIVGGHDRMWELYRISSQ